MLILLPPSEGKAAPEAGPSLDLDALVFAEELSPSRQKLTVALTNLCEGPAGRAVKSLGISSGQVEDVGRNAAIASAPCAPASSVYTGVLFDRLDLPGLKPKASERAERHVLIASALWGFVRPGDVIPYYRFSMKARLPRIGPLAAFWKPSLKAAMDGHGFDREDRLILDMRSAAYSAAWRPDRAKLLPVKAFTETGGVRKAVSHMAKATRGEVARVVLEAGSLPDDPDSAAALIEDAGYRVELSPVSLDVIV